MRPLAGRRLWLVGIGGAGMSALATVCRAWGAEVAGSDRSASETTAALERAGIRVAIGHAATNVPDGWEVVASSAIAPDNLEVSGRVVRRRGELLAELVALAPSIVVAGAHGKTTTTAMIAFCLDRLGLEPTFLVGGAVPQLATNARAGSGWLVAEGDESDRSLLELAPKVAVLTNVDLDHHATFASRAEVEDLFDEWLGSLPAGATVVRGDMLPPYAGPLAVPGTHNRANAACALAALAAAGVAAADAAPVLATFTGAARRLQLFSEAAGVRVYDDYAHHPAEVAATLAALRELLAAAPGARLLVLFQPHLFSRTRHLAQEFGQALAAADAVCVSAIYPAREQPVAGVDAKLVVDAICRARPGMTVGLAPDPAAGARLLAPLARRGDIVVTVGAGDVDGACPLLVELLAARA